MGFRDKILGRDKVKETTHPKPSSPVTTIQTTQRVTPGSAVSQSSSTPQSSVVVPVTPPKQTNGPQNHANAALQKALEEYVATLTEAERKVYLDAASNPQSIDDLFKPTSTQNESHEKRSFLRAHSEGISQFLSVFDRFLDLSATGLSAAPQFVSIAVGATQVVIQIFTGFLSYFSRLSGMFGTFASYLGSLNKWAETATKSDNIQEALKVAYIDILNFLRRARLVFVNEKGEERRNIGWRVFWRNTWKPFEEEFASIEQDFQNHLQALRTASSAENLGATFELLKAETDRRERERRDEKEDFLRWLSNIAFEDIHDNIHRKQHPGTGEWLIHDSRYQSLLTGTSSTLLWCRGKPGSGKSVLASSVIEDLTATKAADDDVGLAFAYFDYRNSVTHDERQIIAALIKQLCRKKNEVPKSYTDTKSESESPLQLGDFESFKMIADQYKETYVVIDGLDECPRDDDRESRILMLEFLSTAVRDLPLLKVVVTSRPESDIADEFLDLGATVISIETSNVQSDIEKYVAAEVKRLRQSQGAKRLRIQNDSLEQEIINELTSKADGMFLWVDLQLKHLCEASRMRKDSEVRKALASLPKGLDATYARNVRQIDDEYSSMRDLAILTLRWVLYCERPLTLLEVQHAIAFHTLSEHEFNNKPELEVDEVIMDACANLLEIVKPTQFDAIIQPIHYSVQEFFTKPTSKSNATENQKLLGNPDEVHDDISASGMKYLIRFHDQNLNVAEPGYLRNSNTYPLLKYVTDSFDYHLSSLKSINQATLNEIIAFLDYSDKFRGTVLSLRLEDASITFAEINMLIYATRLFSIPQVRKHYENLPSPDNALVFACSAGLEEAVDELLAKGVDINAGAKGMYARDTPLIAAIRHRQLSVISKLLKKGADPNKPNGTGPNQVAPLYLAAGMGPIQMIELLIQHGADVNGIGRDGTCALQSAANAGRADRIKLLLDNGADLNFKNGHPQRAVVIAAAAGSRDVLDLLLEHGGNVNFSWGTLGTPLQAVCGSHRVSNKVDLARYLIGKGAEVNAQGGGFGSAIQAAARSGQLGLIKVLLEHGADINIQGGKYGSALIAAIANQHIDVMKYMVDQGASFEVRSGKYGSALQAACYGDPTTLQYFIDKGANVNTIGGYYGTALQLAAYFANIEVAQVLLAHKANVNIQAGQYSNALLAALSSTKENWPEMVELLLDHGADPNSSHKSEWAIHKAAERGNEPVFVSLLRKGAKVDVKTDRSATAFTYAIEKGHEAIVRLLIEAKPADLDVQEYLGNALQLAAADGHLSIVRILLDAGADIDGEDGTYGTAVAAATRFNFRDVVGYLVEKGAVVEDEDEESSSESSAGEDEDVNEEINGNNDKDINGAV